MSVTIILRKVYIIGLTTYIYIIVTKNVYTCVNIFICIKQVGRANFAF